MVPWNVCFVWLYLCLSLVIISAKILETESRDEPWGFSFLSIKVPMKRNFFISLFQIAFKMTKNGVYFIMIAFLVAELFKFWFMQIIIED